jgi:hypothetical protein
MIHITYYTRDTREISKQPSTIILPLPLLYTHQPELSRISSDGLPIFWIQGPWHPLAPMRNKHEGWHRSKPYSHNSISLLTTNFYFHFLFYLLVPWWCLFVLPHGFNDLHTSNDVIFDNPTRLVFVCFCLGLETGINIFHQTFALVNFSCAIIMCTLMAESDTSEEVVNVERTVHYVISLRLVVCTYIFSHIFIHHNIVIINQSE